MKRKALVVEEDDQNGTDAEDAILSLGHEPLRARNRREAERLIDSHDFAYALVCLALRARPRGKPKLECSLNLMDRLQREKGPGKVPVIVTSELEAIPTPWIRDIIDLGAAEFVTKPFSLTGRRLSKIISKLLQLPFLSIAYPLAEVAETTVFSGRFVGGELKFAIDHAELCGIKIVGDNGFGCAIKLLRTLAAKDANGHFVHRSAEELAHAIGAHVGVNTVTAGVQTIRKNATSRLKKYLGLDCHADDVIRTDHHGYCLREWITVVGDDSVMSLHVPGASIDVTGVTAHVLDVPGLSQDSAFNERQLWVIDQVAHGARVERAMLEKRFGVHARTAKRDLAQLVERRLVRFVRVGKAGYYGAAG